MQNYSSRLMNRIVAWRLPLLILGLALGAIAYVPSKELQFDRAIENMFAADDPLLPPYRQLKRTFGGNEVLLAAYVDPQILTASGIERLTQLNARLQKVPGVLATLSINSGPLGDRIIDSQNPLSKSFLELFEGYTIGADHQTVGVACLLDAESTVARQQVVDEIRTILHAHDETGMLVGEPVMVVDGFRYLEQDGFLLGVVSTGLLVLTIIVCFRSLRWTIVPLLVVQVALLITQATLVLSQIRLSMVSSMLTAIVTIIGVGTTVHIIVRFREKRAQGASPSTALAVTGTMLAAPILWSIATDVVGFSALLAAKVGPIQDFGLMMAIGSAIVLFCIVFVVPGASLIGRVDADPQRAWGEHHLENALLQLSEAVEKRTYLLWLGTVVISVFAILGISRLQIETDFTKNFRATSPIVRSYAFVEERLGGAGVWDIIIPAPEKLDSEFLRKLSRCETRLRQEVTGVDDSPALTKVMSVADILQAGSLGAIERLPALAQDAMLQTALGQMQAQMPAFMNTLVGRDPENRQHYVRMMLRSPERQPAEQKQSLINRVTEIAQEEFPGTQVTGFFVLLTNLVESTTRDQWTTFILASFGVFLIGLIAFRSLRIALISLVPNALPIFIVTGLMGWMGLKINMGAAMIASVSMGLSVDSSMHYLTDYLNQRRAGLSVHAAIAEAHQQVGRAMFFSTLALMIGFSALCLSQFVPTIYFGALVGLTMFGGLVGNLILLPLLLASTERDR